MYVAIQGDEGEPLSHWHEADAEDAAKEFLLKQKWFSNNEAKDADYIWMP